MTDLATALALVLVLEGLLWALAPEGPSASWEDRRAGRQAQGEETAVATPAPAQPANAID
jgi:hypothetical protein